MSESKVDGVEPKAMDSVQAEDSKKDSKSSGASEETVSRETYVRTVDEVKKLKSKLAEIEKQEKERKTKEAQDQGRWQELADAAKKEADEAKAQRDELRKSYGSKAVKSQLKEVLMSEGCTDIDEVIQLTNWSEKITVDPETFDVKADDVKKVVEEWKKKKPTWFKTQKTNVQHVQMSNKPVVGANKPVSVKDMAYALASKMKEQRR